MTMRTTAQSEQEQEIALEIVSKNADSDFETVVVAKSPAPTSIRLSAPLLQALDALAERQHRKRGNLIQHVLWEYVKSQ